MRRFRVQEQQEHERTAVVLDFATALDSRRRAKVRADAEDRRFRELHAIDFCTRHEATTAAERELVAGLFAKLVRNRVRILNDVEEGQLAAICRRLRKRDEAFAALEDARDRWEARLANEDGKPKPGRDHVG